MLADCLGRVVNASSHRGFFYQHGLPEHGLLQLTLHPPLFDAQRHFCDVDHVVPL